MTVVQSSGMKDEPHATWRGVPNRKETAMGRRLIATVGIFAIGFVGALSIAAPASAAPAAVTTQKCSFPEPQDEVSAKALVPELANCLEIVFTDKCDGTTLVQATNWVTNDNKWTVVKLKVDGNTQTLRGGSTPDVGSWTVNPPSNRDDATHDGIQPRLVYDFSEGDIDVHLEKDFGKPHVWKDPGEICQSPSPSPSPSASASASASPSPSVSVTTAPASTTTAPVAGPQNLPVTGASATLPIVTGSTLLVAAVAYWGFVLYRRRKADAQA